MSALAEAAAQLASGGGAVFPVRASSAGTPSGRPASKSCRECGAEFAVAGRGRVSELCPACRKRRRFAQIVESNRVRRQAARTAPAPAGAVTLAVHPFPGLDPGKPQAVKVLEEAAEAFAAWQAWDKGGRGDEAALALADELADAVQAACNLAAAAGIDLAAAMGRCTERNRERGRL